MRGTAVSVWQNPAALTLNSSSVGRMTGTGIVWILYSRLIVSSGLRSDQMTYCSPGVTTLAARMLLGIVDDIWVLSWMSVCNVNNSGAPGGHVSVLDRAQIQVV